MGYAYKTDARGLRVTAEMPSFHRHMYWHRSDLVRDGGKLRNPCVSKRIRGNLTQRCGGKSDVRKRIQYRSQQQQPPQVIHVHHDGKGGCFAMIMSFFIPGLEQIYKGQTIRGLLYLVIAAVLFLISVATAGLGGVIQLPFHIAVCIGAGLSSSR